MRGTKKYRVCFIIMVIKCIFIFPQITDSIKIQCDYCNDYISIFFFFVFVHRKYKLVLRGWPCRKLAER